MSVAPKHPLYFDLSKQGGTTAVATASSDGTVKVNTDDPGGDPKVYRTTEVDAAIAVKYTAAPATAATRGLVKVNTDDPGSDPVVYRKSEVDALIATVTAEALAALGLGTAASVAVTPDPFYVQVGNTKQLTAVATDSAGHTIIGKTCSWASSDSTIATVSSTGLVTALKPGTFTITATADGHNSNAAAGEVLLRAEFYYKVGDDYGNATLGNIAFKIAQYLAFGRSSTAWAYNDHGICQMFQPGVLPIAYLDGNYYALLMSASTNFCKWSDDLSQWTSVSTPTLTSGKDDIWGSNIGYNISDTSNSVVQGKKLTLNTMTTNAAKKGVIFAIRKGSVSSAHGSLITIADTTVSATRLSMTVTWSGSTPVVTANTGVFFKAFALVGGWYAIHCQTTAITVANTNVFEIDPAGTAAEQGDVDFGAVHIEDGTVPTMPIPTTGAARVRNADTSTTEIGFQYDTTQSCTLYFKSYDLGNYSDQANSGDFSIGVSGNDRILLGTSSTQKRRITLSNSGTAVTADADNGSIPAYGSITECRGAASTGATPTGTVGTSVNGAAEVTGTSGAGAAYTGALYTSQLYNAKSNGVQIMAIAGFLHVHTALSMAQCRKYFS